MISDGSSNGGGPGGDGNPDGGPLGDGDLDGDAASDAPDTDDASARPAGTHLTAGERHACALVHGGVRCWGSNSAGELGNNTIENSNVPVTPQGLTDVVGITAGGIHTCALHGSGKMSCWGGNFAGELGNGQSGTFSRVPVEVPGMTDVTAVAAGGAHTCALHRDGTVSCWGENRTGQLGTGDFEGTTKPKLVPKVNDATALATGTSHTCVIRKGGAMSCWGLNTDGEVGNPAAIGVTNVPTDVLEIHDAIALATGDDHTCMVHENDGGGVSCWGDNENSELANGNRFSAFKPTTALGVTDAVLVTAGLQHTCILHGDTSVACWGDDTHGQVGNGIVTPIVSSPTRVPGVFHARAVVAGDVFSCALLQGDAVLCWGQNDVGELGNGKTGGNTATPVSVTNL